MGLYSDPGAIISEAALEGLFLLQMVHELYLFNRVQGRWLHFLSRRDIKCQELGEGRPPSGLRLCEADTEQVPATFWLLVDAFGEKAKKDVIILLREYGRNPLPFGKTFLWK